MGQPSVRGRGRAPFRIVPSVSPLGPRAPRIWLLVLATFAASPAAGAEDPGPPAVARPVLRAGSDSAAAGTVFFLSAPGAARVAAIGAAHSFDLAKLAAAQEVRFQLGRSQRLVGSAARLLAAPGRPFSEPGASLRGDHVLFALEAPPLHVRVLEADRARVREGARVRLLGIPGTLPQDEDEVFGFVKESSDARILVDLDVLVDLRGWGGAPLLDHESGKVIGMLQAAVPGETRLGVVCSPIAGVLDALASPLDAGRGAPFASAAATTTPAAAAGAATPRSDPISISRRETPAPPAPRGPDAPASDAAAAPETVGPAAEDAPAGGERKRLLETPAGETLVVLEIEHPYAGAIFGAESGAFVAGRAVALRGELKRFDVILVLDTSGSTKEMSGADVNGNGLVGENRMGGLFGSSDPGDSILAAEVAAAKQLLRGLDARSTRVGLVTFAGEPPEAGGLFGGRPAPPAITEEALTQDYARIDHSLDRVLARGPEGLTHMKAGVEQAVIELIGARGAVSETDAGSEKIVLFLTDGQPTLPYDPLMKSDNTKAVLRAADQAARAGVRIHSFAIGPEALDGPVAAVEMATRTEGHFTPVRNPGDLVDLIDEVNFANLESIEVRNLSMQGAPSLVETRPDGSWNALVALVVGKNRIEVTARANDGTQISRTIEVAYAPGAADPALARELLPRRTALLERRLLELRRGRLEAEREAVEHTRKELLLEIEKERSAAEERAEEQRKELDLEAKPE